MFKYLIKLSMKPPIPMLNIVRRRRRHTKDLPYDYFVKSLEYSNLIERLFKVTETKSRQLLLKHQHIFDLPCSALEDISDLCRSFNVNTTTLTDNPKLLYWPLHTLANRIVYLQDMGIEQLDAAMVSCFMDIVNLRIDVFKIIMKLPRSEVMADRLLRILPPKPDHVAPLEIPGEHLTLTEYHNHCLRWFLKWRLDMDGDDTRTWKTVMYNLKYRSLTYVSDMIDVLLNDAEWTIDELKSQSRLGCSTPQDLRAILTEIKSFCGVPFKEMIKIYPELTKMNYRNVVRIMELLERYAIPDVAQLTYPLILLKQSHVVDERLANLERFPELRVLKKNPKSLQLIDTPARTEARLAGLRMANIKYATVNAMCRKQYDLRKYIRTGKDHSKITEIKSAFSEMLRIDENEFADKIRQHPYYSSIDLLSICETVDYLLKCFAPEDLHESIQIILYSREKIAEVLQKIRTSKPSTVEERRVLATPKYLIAMCLYELEYEHHFTGDGVWRTEYETFTRDCLAKTFSDLDEGNDSDEEGEVDKNDNTDPMAISHSKS